MNQLGLGIAPIILFLTGGGLLLMGDQEPTDFAAPATHLAAAATGSPAGAPREGDGEVPVDARPLEARSFREVREQLEKEAAETAEAAPAPATVAPAEPVAHLAGRLQDMRRRPLEVAAFRVFPAEGEARSWWSRVHGLPDAEASIASDTFRIPLYSEDAVHVAVRTKSGRWFLIESVAAGSEDLVIELPVDPGHKKKKSGPRTANLVNPAWNRAYGTVVWTTAINAKNRKFIHTKNWIDTKALVHLDKSLSNWSWDGTIRAAGSNGSHDGPASPQNGSPNNFTNLGLQILPHVLPHVVNADPGAQRDVQVKGTVTGWLNAKVDPVGNPDRNGVVQTFEWKNLKQLADVNVNGLRINGQLVHLNPTFGNAGAPAEAGKEKPVSRDPACLPTRAWDDRSGAEYYCWDLDPAAR